MNYLFNFNSSTSKENFLKRLHPIIKFIMLIFFMILLSQISNYVLKALVVFILIFYSLATSKSKKMFSYLFLSVALVAFSYFLMYLFLGTDKKVIYTIYTIIKIFSFVLPIYIYNINSSIDETIYCFEILLNPLRLIKIPVNDIILLLTITFNFLPLTLKEFDRILLMQSMRGLDFKTSPISLKVKIIINSLTILLNQLLKKSNNLAIAIELRGYNSFNKRSTFKKYKLYNN